MENIKLSKYDSSYENIILDYIIDFFGYHSFLAGADKTPKYEQAKENLLQWSSDNHELYIIEFKNMLVGFMHIWYKGNNVAWIEDIFVDEKYRRKGIGSLAIKEAENIILQKPQYTAVCIDVVPQNKNALDLYYKLGYDTLSIITVRKELKENNRKDTTDFLGNKFKI